MKLEGMLSSIFQIVTVYETITPLPLQHIKFIASQKAISYIKTSIDYNKSMAIVKFVGSRRRHVYILWESVSSLNEGQHKQDYGWGLGPSVSRLPPESIQSMKQDNHITPHNTTVTTTIASNSINIFHLAISNLPSSDMATKRKQHQQKTLFAALKVKKNNSEPF